MSTLDLEVYSYSDLTEDPTSFAGLLEEDNELNDETFGDVLGDAEPLGRDFDFAGSTNRFLGTDAASGAGLQASKSNASPWGTLNDDPLLSRASKSTYSIPAATTGGGHVENNATPARSVKTLEEVEAEMRANAQPAVPAGAPTGPRPLTVEEVEAEMMRSARQAAQGPLTSHPMPPPAFPVAQPAISSPPPGNAPPAGMFPPGMPPAMMAMLYAQHLQQERQRLGQAQVGQLPPGVMRPASEGPQQSPVPLPQNLQAFPPLGSNALPLPLRASQGDNLMTTLFPPLPSQGQAMLSQQPVTTANLAQVEQQLNLLSINQYAQHPSLTSAHLHSLLQQAHKHAAARDGGENADVSELNGSEEAERRKAGEDIIKRVELRILEHERIEMMRKKKALKIASMARHNNLMSNSDKDFITRIQVSQLITDDPYADDFYFHIMAAIKNARQHAILAAINQGQQASLVGSVQTTMQETQGGMNAGATPQNGNRRPTRRENAMNRMAQNVQRLVDSAKKRNANTPTTLSLDGALGKIATRTRSAPRPLLQVTPTASATSVPTSSNLMTDADTSSASPTPNTNPSQDKGESLLTGAGLVAKSNEHATTEGPLTHRQTLAIIERLYDTVLDLEQLRRIQPALATTERALRDQYEQITVQGEVKEQTRLRYEAAQRETEAGNARYEELRENLWEGLHIMDPLDACVPHPFISVLSVLKGKRLLPRAIRHLSAEQTLTLLTLLVATFDTLDVVTDAPLLDQLDTTGSIEAKQKRLAVEAKTEALLNAVVAPIMQVVGASQLRMVTGMLGLLLDRNDLNSVVRSKPGLAFLTILLSRAESLNQSTPSPDASDLEQWQQTFTYLFSVLSSSLLTLFPSTRMAASVPFGVAQYQSVDALRPEADFDDEPVWRFLASVAVCANPDQQQVLVTSVRDKVIEGVKGAKMGRGNPELSAVKIRNVNLLLHALSLDASMIEID